ALAGARRDPKHSARVLACGLPVSRQPGGKFNESRHGKSADSMPNASVRSKRLSANRGRFHPKDTERRDLLEVIEDRSERSSTLIAAQLPVSAWHQAIGEP